MKKTTTKKAGSLTQSQVLALDANIKIFTDGACDPNPGEAGSGLALYQDNELTELWYGLYASEGTNNLAELNALHQALLMAETYLNNDLKVTILCDSVYAINCITQWAQGWEKKGWKKSGGEIKNLSLIQTMYRQYLLLKDRLTISHVNGHVGIEGNEMADRMSILAIDEREPDFCRYTGALDVPGILAMRAG